jgi:anti-sigma factor RsiW
MTISDETLMAYADGELDAAARAAVESAMREDPKIEKRVAAHRLLRQKVQAAYSSELAEDVPNRLLTAARQAANGSSPRVVNLKDARAAMERNVSRPVRPPQWRSFGTIAASVIAGVGVGFFMWGQTRSPVGQDASGALIARGPLAQALSNQLAAEQPPKSAVQIGLSYLAKSGDYCRTFALSGAVSPAGVACRHGEEWRVEALTQSAGAAGDSSYRTAASPIPAAILKSVEAQIAGEPLDQAGERSARQQGWKTAVRQ